MTRVFAATDSFASLLMSKIREVTVLEESRDVTHVHVRVIISFFDPQEPHRIVDIPISVRELLKDQSGSLLLDGYVKKGW